MHELLSIDNLKLGMVIVKITQQQGPVSIQKSGLVSSVEMIQGLREMGVTEVQIDPQQSVEISSATSLSSPTQRMLNQNIQVSAKASESGANAAQAHVFLPSVQDLPSPYLFYFHRYVSYVVLAVLGLGLGWGLTQLSAVKSSGLFAQYQNKTLVDKPTSQQTPTQPEKTHAVEVEVSDLESSQTAVESLPITTTNNDSAQPISTLTQQNELSAVVQNEITEAQALEVLDEIIPETEANISPELLARFEQAINSIDTEPKTEPTAAQQDKDTLETKVPRIDQLPAWVMTRLPSMAFSAHMYASDASERWVRVNGTRMIEGDKIEGSVEIIRIDPQHVILNYAGQSFSMAALTDW
ncbi:general secretion pathway protein GspB [Paraglaciecola aestuariivivens]